MPMKKNTPKKKILIVSVGRYFYTESGTRMGSLYQKVGDFLYRCDWGTVENALNEGHNVSMRPANPKEMEWALKTLQEIKK